MAGFETVRDALEARDLLKGGWGDNQMAVCPSHDDTTASLSLREGDDGKALVHCFASCTAQEVVSSLGLSMSDLFTSSRGDAIEAVYEYTDEKGEPLSRVLRYEGKKFSQERWEDGEWKPGLRDTRRILYRLPELLAADGARVWIVEGEKDADAIAALGEVATCSIGGAGKWQEEYDNGCFDSASYVYIVADRDEPGRKHAAQVRESLGRGTILEAAVGKDVSDHLAADLTLDQLVLPDEAVEFEPWDWSDYETPDHEWILEPWIPRASRVLVYGASGSLKSLFAAWVGANVAREGGRVGYFNLEMSKGVFAKRMRQLPAVSPSNFKVFSKFMFGQSLQTAIKNFEGWDLLIVDSWSQAQGSIGSTDNDAISRLDAEFFQPLIAATGATILILDNTGKDLGTDSGFVKNRSARGASRKTDIQEIALWMDRPEERDNFKAVIRCTKMRLDVQAPEPVTVATPQDTIDFRVVRHGELAESMWPNRESAPTPDAMDKATTPSSTAPATTKATDAAPVISDSDSTEAILTGAEARALARARDFLKKMGGPL